MQTADNVESSAKVVKLTKKKIVRRDARFAIRTSLREVSTYNPASLCEVQKMRCHPILVVFLRTAATLSRKNRAHPITHATLGQIKLSQKGSHMQSPSNKNDTKIRSSDEHEGYSERTTDEVFQYSSAIAPINPLMSQPWRRR